MSFPAKFKLGGSNTNDVPQGVNIENTSFGYNANQKPYIKPPMQNNPQNAQKTKPRGGWDDDDDDGSTQIRGGSGPYKTNQTNQQSQGIQELQSPASTHSTNSGELGFVSKPKKINPSDYEILQIDENFVASHEFENRTINDLIQPGGARMKQPDSALNGFCKAAESFPAPVIGSLLLSKLNEEIPFVSKARILFLLEAIVKKVKKYYDYFHHNLEILRQYDFSNEGMNGNQLKKILDDIIKYIEEPNKPKQIPVVSNPTTSATYSNTSANLLDEDLLGGASSQPKGKQDPFGFIKKSTSDSSSSQSQGSNHQYQQQQQQHFELLDTPVESQPFPQQQAQAQPKKFNPFDLNVGTGSNSSPFPQNTPQQTTQNKPTGLPGNFKKFQPSASASETPTSNNNANLLDGGNTPTQTTANHSTATKFDQLDDLLAATNDLTIGSNELQPKSTQPSWQNTNQNQTQNQGFGTPSNQNQNQSQPQGNQGGWNTQNNHQQQQQQFGQNNQNNNNSSQQQNQGWNNNVQGQNQGNQPQTQNQGQFNKPNMPTQNQFGQGHQQQGGYHPQQQMGYPQGGYPQQMGGFQGGYPQQMGGFQGYPQGYPQGGYPMGYPQGGYPQQMYPNYGYGQGQFGGQQQQQNFQGQYQNQGNQGNNSFNQWQPGKK